MNTTIISPIQRLDPVAPSELSQLKEWLKYIEPFMIKSVSTYAQGRRELHLRHFVKLAGKDAQKLGDEVVKVPSSAAKKYKSELIESIGEKLLPGFHEGLVLHYPKGTLIKPHRDSRAYAKGAASVNIIGNAAFFISHNQDATNMQSYQLGEGDCIQFDNKQPHAIAKVLEDRWCVCFFYLKEEFLPKPSQQLALFAETRDQESGINDQLPITTTPKIYTSYYAGKQIGKSISISLWKPKAPRKGHEFEHLPEFAPSAKLLNYWKESSQGAEAVAYYTKTYLKEMSEKDKEIDEWLNNLSESVTLNCFEEDNPEYTDNPFCHRHLFGQIIKQKKPHLWGGEVAYVLLKNQDPTPPNIGFMEGEEIKYYSPKDKAWVEAIVKQAHTTSFAKPGQFSFIEVLVNNKIQKAFSISQTQKIEGAA